jgi:hypothetical protein
VVRVLAGRIEESAPLTSEECAMVHPLKQLALLLLLVSPAGAVDHGQFNDYELTPEQKSWIMGMTNSKGVSCCSIADGYPVPFKIVGDHFEVLFQGVWRYVPNEAVRKVENPIGVPIAWFEAARSGYIVRCFVPDALK